jgi:hypothetical protein
MDYFQRTLFLMNKWNSDEGATNEELLELKELLKQVNENLDSALADRL